ncbi:chloride channel protein 2-like [Amphibalanus amphitrite]|uniref:chloride channel protein 2-like n=1 Tax=Amphibalanus amphitrite TaxID=1232801 RepID=UPI001C905F0B|nr:chloride channel protein 2-like [Amphibalanus amphitrite]
MVVSARIWLYRDLTTHPVLQYIAWVTLPISLILFSAGFVHIVSKSAVGSGIPEMKTILRGVPLDEYLTFRTLVAKVVGLTACLGSGIPLGKEGPFVHIASIVATLLTRMVTSFKGIYENESRNSEMLAAACAVGVACSFAAPIGGVLFSIEVTSVYFAVRNYWRGFFAAVCGAMVFRLLAVWFEDEETITALFKTDFKVDFPFDPQELFVFALIGAVAGFAGAFFVWLHRRYVVFMRSNSCMKSFLSRNRFLYPFLVALLISSTTFPLGLGQFLAADQTTHDQVLELFANFTWSSSDLTVDEAEAVNHWTNPYTSFYANLCIYILVTFGMCVVASTLPVPSGIFIPVFKMGAAFGRLVGELLAMWFPQGVRYGGHISPIRPGGYSIVGAAALAGSVTHTISTSVIVFELTGQITHILPVMIAVLIANAVSQLLQPSIYDSIIQIKKLPYLPDILTSTNAYSIYVEDIMVREVKYIWHGISHRQLRQVLRENKKLSSVPLVDSHESMILLGSIKRKHLVLLLEKHLGRDRRMEVVTRWQRAAQKVRLSRPNRNWKDLVALATLERREELRREHEAAEAADVAACPEPPAEEEPSVVEVSGARLACPSDDEREAEEEPVPVRRTSRFAVTPVKLPSLRLSGAEAEEKESDQEAGVVRPSSPTPSDAAAGRRPLKPILKKTNSFRLSPSSREAGHVPTPYATVTGGTGDSRMQTALDHVLQSAPSADGKKAASSGDSPDENCAREENPPRSRLTPTEKRVTLPVERVIDMSYEDQKLWEEEELDKEVNFEDCKIDPAPFQLVERTSLLKVHSLFSMLGLNHAYVTAIGRLIGVVALKELRQAIQRANHFSPDEDVESDSASSAASSVSHLGLLPRAVTEQDAPSHRLTEDRGAPSRRLTEDRGAPTRIPNSVKT